MNIPIFLDDKEVEQFIKETLLKGEYAVKKTRELLYIQRRRCSELISKFKNRVDMVEQKKEIKEYMRQYSYAIKLIEEGVNVK